MEQSLPEIENVKDRLAVLLCNPVFSELSVNVGPEKTPVYACRAILGISSPYFEDLLYGPDAVTGNDVDIPGVDPEIFRIFLQYIYTDYLDDLDEKDAWQLLSFAKMCGVKHLERKCREQIITMLDDFNALNIYAKAFETEETEIAETALRYIDWHVSEIVRTNEFLEVDLDTMCRVLERSSLRAREIELYDAIISWSEAACVRKGLEVTPENRRIVLGKAVDLIRCTLMTDCEKAARQNDGVFPKMEKTDARKEKKPKLEIPSKSKRVFAPKLYYAKRFPDLTYTGGLIKEFTRGGDFGLSLRIMSDKQIFLHGVRAFGACGPYEEMDSVITEVSVRVSQETQDGCQLLRTGKAKVERFEEVPENPDVLIDVMFDVMIIKPDVTYIIDLSGSISCNAGYKYEMRMDLDAKCGKNPLSEIVVGSEAEGKVARVTVISPPTSTIPSKKEKFAVGNLPEFIFSF